MNYYIRCIQEVYIENSHTLIICFHPLFSGAADVSDDDSDEDEDDVESDAATAGSSVSESRERALNVSMMPPSRVPSPAVKISPAPRVGGPTGAPAAVAAGAGAGTIPAEAAPSLPQEGENDAAAASRADRNAMPPPPPTAPILIPGLFVDFKCQCKIDLSM